MAIDIERTFVVKAPAPAVWTFLTDPRSVAKCLPGTAITGQTDDGAYTGTITVKVGPVAATYKGRMRFERLDEVTRTAEIVASGQDVRGKGGADMRMTSRLVERSPQETEVVVTTSVNVVGMLAQFGRGMIQDVSDQMFTTFTEAARAELEAAGAAAGEASASAAAVGSTVPPTPPGAQPPLDALSLGAAVVGRAATRLLRRPIVWVGVLLLLLLGYLLIGGGP